MAEDAPEDAADPFAGLAELDAQQFVLASASTLASLAFAKLEAGDLGQAKTAIDAVSALVALVEGDAARDLKGALANLQVAYASRSL